MYNNVYESYEQRNVIYKNIYNSYEINILYKNIYKSDKTYEIQFISIYTNHTK